MTRLILWLASLLGWRPCPRVRKFEEMARAGRAWRCGLVCDSWFYHEDGERDEFYSWGQPAGGRVGFLDALYVRRLLRALSEWRIGR